MRLECLKYRWVAGTLDVEINFFSDTVQQPNLESSIDLYDYYILDTMSDVSYSKEAVESSGSTTSLLLECSNLNFQCITDIYSGTDLIDYFEIFTKDKYTRYKFNYYDDDDILIYTGILYKDGIDIDAIENQILSFTVIGYEKEFKEYYTNKPLEQSTHFASVESGVNGLKYFVFESALQYNFIGVDFNFTDSITNGYYMAEKPFTYLQSRTPGMHKFKDYGDILHIKTGYECYRLDTINKFTWLDSIMIPMGWVWFFYLGKLVIQERAAADYDVLELDYDNIQLTNAVSHNYNQFQVDNIIIEDGRYFDKGSDRQSVNSCFSVNDRARGLPDSEHVTHTLTGDVAVIYSNISVYLNQFRPFRTARIVNVNHYQLRPEGHTFTREYLSDDYNTYLNRTYLYRQNEVDLFTFIESRLAYNSNTSLILKPYINSDDNSGAIDINNIFAEDNNPYYGAGNYFKAAIQTVTNSQGFYNGSAANSIFSNDSGNLYINYEMYSQSETFRKNFRKFLKSNDEIIFEVSVKQLITNPLQNIKITNYPYANIEDKIFSILKLSFNERKRTSKLTLQMI